MRQMSIKLRQKIIKKIAILTLILSILSATAFPALGDDDEGTNFLIPDHGYTVDYYRSYGEPAIRISITGDPEFSRGETADLSVKIVNAGVIDGFQRLNAKQKRIPDSVEERLAEDEMEKEKDCTIAKDIKATLVSESEYIKVEPTASLQTVGKLETGHSASLRYTIKIDGDAPAGNYELLLPVNYQYQANVRTATADVINLGLADTKYARDYKAKTETFRLRVSVEDKPKFEVTKVSGSLAQGEPKAIEVTYKNSREGVAKDALARIVVMSPLSTEKSIVRLGDIGPGENKTAKFEISADKKAILKNYGINSEIKYINEDGETSFSQNMKINVPLEAAEKKFSITGVAIILIILIALYQIINVHRKRNKNNENASGDENE
ncbi:MAG: hypothetical protein PHG79_07600 [Methanosarcina sp.]|jgi:hypothetical protein|nr:hypothetical protein [Methanosarcina sp.]MDD3873087.1 hypothetical protein [Methanosarcina sp.]MDD4523053.1 hypothetical protein [Methanosarcina sp.]HHV24104.1 hypothetical protein [Methanosarcina sp.]